MSAVGLKLLTVLCLTYAVLGGPESSGVEWRNPRGAVTIQCGSDAKQDILTLKKGLKQEDIFVLEDSGKNIIDKELKGRLQFNGPFPNVDILIKNLTSDDTGPYWCSYSKFDEKSSKILTTEHKGSVLLVVTETVMPCEQGNKDLVLVSVVISAAVLLGIIMGFLIWIILKTKSLRRTMKPRHATTNDVYEDMRGTLRR